MTQKFIGNIVLDSNTLTIQMPTELKIPEKREWSKYPIFSFNGHRYSPLTPLAESNVELIVTELRAAGKTSARKPGARKSTSLKYAILTTGVEDFIYC